MLRYSQKHTLRYGKLIEIYFWTQQTRKISSDLDTDNNISDAAAAGPNLFKFV